MAVVNRIDVDTNGTMFIRFRKDDGGWHRVSIPADANPDVYLDAVDQHLALMGRTKIVPADKQALRARHQEEKEKRNGKAKTV